MGREEKWRIERSRGQKMGTQNRARRGKLEGERGLGHGRREERRGEDERVNIIANGRHTTRLYEFFLLSSLLNYVKALLCDLWRGTDPGDTRGH